MYFPKTVNRALITWFGCGRVPFAPGTMGSLGALPLCWLLAATNTEPLFRVLFAAGFTAIACLAAAQDQATGGQRDPNYIVIDEVVGMLWSTILVSAHWIPMLIAFVFFRIFDIVKPHPAIFFDRWSKTSLSIVRRGAHIVLDDVIAGIYALLVTHLILIYFFPEIPRFSF